MKIIIALFLFWYVLGTVVFFFSFLFLCGLRTPEISDRYVHKICVPARSIWRDHFLSAQPWSLTSRVSRELSMWLLNSKGALTTRTRPIELTLRDFFVYGSQTLEISDFYIYGIFVPRRSTQRDHFLPAQPRSVTPKM